MATDSSATRKDERSEGSLGARPRGRGPRYRISVPGTVPSDIRTRVSAAHVSAIRGRLEADREAKSP